MDYFDAQCGVSEFPSALLSLELDQPASLLS